MMVTVPVAVVAVVAVIVVVVVAVVVLVVAIVAASLGHNISLDVHDGKLLG